MQSGFGNPVRIGDGFATVSGYELPGATGNAGVSGKAGVRFEAPSQDINPAVLVRSRLGGANFFDPKKDEASLEPFSSARVNAFILRWAGGEGFFLSGAPFLLSPWSRWMWLRKPSADGARLIAGAPAALREKGSFMPGWNSRGLLAVAVVVVNALTVGGPPLRADSTVVTVETFDTDPAARGWVASGDAALFAWDAAARDLAVTWDSSRPNSYFRLPLRTFLTRADDFRLEFDLTLEDLQSGTSPDKPYTFELALGFLNTAEAAAPGFLRGTGVDSPDLVEWNYFPDSGFGATVAAAMISHTNAWATSFNTGDGLVIGTTYRFVLDYRAAQQAMAVRMIVGGQTHDLQTATIREPFGDFAVDALAVASYSDAGQDPLYAGSILAHGRIDNVRLETPAPPIRRFVGGPGAGRWAAEFTSWLGWHYTLVRSTDLREWVPVGATVDGTGLRQTLSDEAPPGAGAFYRVKAETN